MHHLCTAIVLRTYNDPDTLTGVCEWVFTEFPPPHRRVHYNSSVTRLARFIVWVIRLCNYACMDTPLRVISTCKVEVTLKYTTCCIYNVHAYIHVSKRLTRYMYMYNYVVGNHVM